MLQGGPRSWQTEEGGLVSVWLGDAGRTQHSQRLKGTQEQKRPGSEGLPMTSAGTLVKFTSL